MRPQKNGSRIRGSHCPSWARTRTLLIQSHKPIFPLSSSVFASILPSNDLRQHHVSSHRLNVTEFNRVGTQPAHILIASRLTTRPSPILAAKTSDRRAVPLARPVERVPQRYLMRLTPAAPASTRPAAWPRTPCARGAT